MKTHIGEALRESPEVLAVLKDELVVGRFVPQEWTGIRGVEPLDLQVKADFPEAMRVRARPINPRLFEVAHKAFERLMS